MKTQQERQRVQTQKCNRLLDLHFRVKRNISLSLSELVRAEVKQRIKSMREGNEINKAVLENLQAFNHL